MKSLKILAVDDHPLVCDAMANPLAEITPVRSGRFSTAVARRRADGHGDVAGPRGESGDGVSGAIDTAAHWLRHEPY